MMRRATQALLVAAALGTALPASSDQTTAGPAWWVRSRTTAYVFQTENGTGIDEDRFGFYQHLGGAVTGIADGKLSFRFSGRAADDLELDERITDRARIYTAYVDARLNPQFSARIGRQFIHRSTLALTVDGALLSYSPTPKWAAEAWGGLQSPLVTSYRDRVGDFGEDAVYGARITMHPDRQSKIGVSIATRERDGVTAETPLGFEGSYRPCRDIALRGHASYDLEQEFWTRAESYGRWQPEGKLPTVTLQFVDRHPRIDATSYFKRFDDVERIQLVRGALRWEHDCRFGGEVEGFGAYVDDRSSTRLGLALLLPYGRVGYSTRFGDTGEEDRWYGDLGISPTDWLRLEGGASISAYALLEDAPDDLERDLISGYGRLRVDIRQGADLILEIQTIENPVYEEDIRFLAGLDLTAAGGTAWSALGPGRWLR